jgi:hypothetical protein
MAYDQKKIQIAVFENTRRKTDKHPVKNVVVTFPNGEKFEGGLWEKQSKNGVEYLSGTLATAQEREQSGYQSRDRAVPSRSAPSSSAPPAQDVHEEVDFG